MEATTFAKERPAVLVVEDEAIVALYLVDLIEELGFAILGPIGNRAEALGLAEGNRPRIAILDVSVAAERDGLAIGAELARRYGTKLIFISGHGDIAELAEVRDLSPVAVLQKPCLPQQIEDALTRAAGLQDPG